MPIRTLTVKPRSMLELYSFSLFCNSMLNSNGSLGSVVKPMAMPSPVGSTFLQRSCLKELQEEINLFNMWIFSICLFTDSEGSDNPTTSMKKKCRMKDSRRTYLRDLRVPIEFN